MFPMVAKPTKLLSRRKAVRKVLYKYYPPERLDIFENWSVRFSNPRHFNDTFDSDYIAQTKSDMYARAEFRNSLGIFCLTESPDDHQMWVNYAKQHTGFVLGFDTNHELFTNDKGRLEKVKYKPTPTEYLKGPPTEELCLYKSKEWSHEEEWRCIRQFTKGQSRDVWVLSATTVPIAIVELIMGSKMEKYDISYILREFESLSDLTKNITINHSKPNLATKNFTHEPTTAKYCTQCKGFGHIQ
jgi:hypothetical protein